MRTIFVYLLLCVIIFTGCQSSTSGGYGDIIYTQTIETVNEFGKPVKTITQVVNKIQQPDAAKNSAASSIEINKDGMARINNSTGGSYNVTQILAEISLLKIPMYVGIGLMLSGLAITFIFKDVKWGIIVGLCGISMSAGSYLLAKYAVWFLILGLGLIAYAVWFIIDKFKQQKGNDEHIKTIDLLKTLGIVDPTKIAEVANVIQSPSTKKIVKTVREKHK